MKGDRRLLALRGEGVNVFDCWRPVDWAKGDTRLLAVRCMRVLLINSASDCCITSMAPGVCAAEPEVCCLLPDLFFGFLYALLSDEATPAPSLFFAEAVSMGVASVPSCFLLCVLLAGWKRQ